MSVSSIWVMTTWLCSIITFWRMIWTMGRAVWSWMILRRSMLRRFVMRMMTVRRFPQMMVTSIWSPMPIPQINVSVSVYIIMKIIKYRYIRQPITNPGNRTIKIMIISTLNIPSESVVINIWTYAMYALIIQSFKLKPIKRRQLTVIISIWCNDQIIIISSLNYRIIIKVPLIVC